VWDGLFSPEGLLMRPVWSTARHPVLVFASAAVLAIVAFRLGRQLGLPILFWNDSKLVQILSGIAVTALLSETLFAGYLLVLSSDHAAASDLWAAGLAAAFAAAALAWIWIRALSNTAAWRVTAPFRLAGNTEYEREHIPWFPLAAGLALGLLPVLGVAAMYSHLHPFLQSAFDTWSGSISTLTFGLFRPGVEATRQPLHALALYLTAGVGTAFAVAAALSLKGKTPVPAAVLICVMLGLLVAFYGLVRFHFPNPTFAFLLVAVLLSAGGVPRFKYRFGALDYSSPRPTLSEYGTAASAAGRAGVPLSAIFVRKQAHQKAAKRPLILLCLSGGGIRAASWATAMLRELETAYPALPLDSGAVTGASGGMVGGSLWVAGLSGPVAPGPISRERKEALDLAFRQSTADSLTAVTARLVLWDVPLLAWPFHNPYDRGRALEERWIETARETPGFAAPLARLATGEREGWRPSLIFTPMLVEDARRLVISNLDLAFLCDSRVGDNRSPRPAFELSRLFPKQFGAFPLATAARMSATFPYVTPAGALPTEPRRRVVDAGYFDDHGTNVAISLLEQILSPESGLAAAFRKTVSRVAIVQIRDEKAADPAGARARPSLGSAGFLGRAYEEISTPLEAVLSVRSEAPAYRNDERLESLAPRIESALGPGSFRVSTFEFDGRASLSWHLSNAERSAIEQSAASPKIRSEVSALASWLSA